MGTLTALLSARVRWGIVPAMLLLIAVVGCGSADGPTPTVAPAQARSAGSAAQAVAEAPVAPSVNLRSPTPPSRQVQATLIAAPPATATPEPTASPTSTNSPTATSTATATNVPTPTATPSPSPTPTPALRQLTTGGCCTQPFWSPDSTWLIYIDKPSPDAPVGFWGVDTTKPGAAPELLTDRIALYTSDLSHVIEYGGGETEITQLAGPLSETEIDRWTVPARGRPISVSPNRTRIAWDVGNSDAPPELRVSEIWVANFDGTDPRSVARLPRGGLSGWITDDVLLLSGRESLDSRETTLYAYFLDDGSTVALLRANRPRGFQLSPDRLWMAFYISLADDPAENGLWLVRTDNSERRQLGRDIFGSYAWRDARHLLIIPFRPDAEFHELWEVDVETGEIRRLTDPAATAIKVANADWRVSPDGRHVAFVESRDDNLWMLTLAD